MKTIAGRDAPAPIDIERTVTLSPDQLPRPEKRNRTGRQTSSTGAAISAFRPQYRLPGQTLGDFRILRPLGSGAMGSVYLAEQISLRRMVALKVLSSARSRQSEYLARFRREAHAVARLVHPNAVQVYCVGTARGHHFIALEYVDGQSLAEMLAARNRVPWRAALEITRQSAMALIRAHKLGIVHRDIKPENILVNRHADVKLADFGLARLQGDPAITEHGGILGTPLYMSPEQARGCAAGPAADIYSLGCVLYHMLTGRPPFTAGDPAGILRSHVSERPRHPASLCRELPREVCALVLRMLSKQRAGRPASARMLITAIARARRKAEAPAEAGDSSAEKISPPGPRPDLLQRISSVALSRRGMRELLAMEATCACLLPRPRRAFLVATMRNYRIPPELMSDLLEKPFFTRADVWELQALKRSAQGKTEALEAIRLLRELEAELGRGLLQACAQARAPLLTP